ncbi:hypothetical protein E2C01_056736 [Portunus trituberculatus]|uniref:Uncharacterized protein n=1 Tax=Portunus trituberculatus TaxID=210409 RepID=A0A5B7GZZ1_PORTR|nr:hypothetical protein [Portunus trituberculatus]
MAEYFQRCTQQALDCNLRCPECDSDLSDYMILRKAIVGLSNPTLKKELFLQYAMYSDVDKPRVCHTKQQSETPYVFVVPVLAMKSGVRRPGLSRLVCQM